MWLELRSVPIKCWNLMVASQQHQWECDYSAAELNCRRTYATTQHWDQQFLLLFCVSVVPNNLRSCCNIQTKGNNFSCSEKHIQNFNPKEVRAILLFWSLTDLKDKGKQVQHFLSGHLGKTPQCLCGQLNKCLKSIGNGMLVASQSSHKCRSV